MKKCLLITLLFLTPFLWRGAGGEVFSQNLVNNWSFEDTLACPAGPPQIDKAAGWSSYKDSRIIIITAMAHKQVCRQIKRAFNMQELVLPMQDL